MSPLSPISHVHAYLFLTCSFRTVLLSYSSTKWDNRTAFLDPQTLAVARVASSLVLLTNEHELKLAKIVAKHGGHMVTNGIQPRLWRHNGLLPCHRMLMCHCRCAGAPMTRSWIEYSVGAASPPIGENENGCSWRSLHVQLFTPLMLNRYDGNTYDEDPLYNHSSMYSHDSVLRHQYMMHPCISVLEHLQFGALSMGYDGMWPNRTGVNIYA